MTAAPPTNATTLRPLIMAAEMFPALEDMVLTARTEALLSFRIFDADTRLRSNAAKAAGLNTWADLLAHTAGRGVAVRLLLADFDPLFTTDLHRSAWASARAFHSAHPEIAIRLAPHGATLGPVWRRIFRRKITEKRQAIKDAPDTADTPPLKAALTGDIRVRPVTLHQKLAVIDGTRAILGGIDVDERRWDDENHSQPAPQTWHDVSMAIDGPAAAPVRAHFRDCWAIASHDGAARFGPDSDPPAAEPPAPAEPKLLRTLSRPQTGPLAFAPRTTAREIETAHIRAFRNANRHVYIETQFFRHRPIARALARAAMENPELQLIVLLPTEPERIIFGGHDGTDARHAQALQLRCLDMLEGAFGPRLAIVSPAKPEPASPEEGKPLAGAGIVYVHAKVAVVDDEIAIIGSANLNGRSMRWDTEAAMAVHRPDFARDLRKRLAGHWLATETDTHRAATWNEAAWTNAKKAPEDREDFILPYPMGRNRRFSLFMPGLPADMF